MRLLHFALLSSLSLGCNFTKNEKSADLNLYFESDIEIDSIQVSDVIYDKEFHFFNYNDAINVDLNDSINDKYAITFFAANDHRMVQLWLDGETLTIKGKVSDKIKILVDTVIGSGLYYKSLDFRRKYQGLLDTKSDSSQVNDFLISELRKEIESPFSIEIADAFVNRNISKMNELRKVFAILSTQNDRIKEHLLNPYRKVETILSMNKIDFSIYRFYDKSSRLNTISLAGDKRYLIDFWFIGCAPCLEDHKVIVTQLTSLSNKNVEVIGISIDKNQEQWTKFLNTKQYPWKNYREIDEAKKQLRIKMMIDVFPTYLLLDSKGVILHRSNTFSEMERYLSI